MRSSVIAFLAVVCALTACEASRRVEVPTVDAMVATTVDRIAITAARSVIPLGDKESLTAQGHKTDSTSEDVTRSVTWASADPAIASIDSAGLVTVHAVGTTAITAALDGATGTLAITVSAAALTTLVVAPDTHAIAKGLALPLFASGTFSDGTVMDLTAMATWTTSAAAIATVSAAGVVQSLALGDTTITATIDGLTASTAITVGLPVIATLAIAQEPLILLIDTTVQLSVTATLTDGTTSDVSARVVWRVTDAAVTVSATGVLHAVANGNATVTAEVDGVTRSTLATVSTPVRLEVGPLIDPPLTATLAQQQRVQLYALLFVTGGGFIDVTATASWSSTAPAIATVTAGRVDTQAQSGMATVTVTASGFSVPVIIQVTTETCHPVINEVLPDGSSASGDLLPSNEWIELYNPCTHAVDVQGWTLAYHGPASASSDTPLVTLSGAMPAGAFRLYAGVGYTGTGAAAPDGVWPGSNGILASPSFGVGLLKPTSGAPVLVSGVAFGTVISNPFLEGSAGPELVNRSSAARFLFDGKDSHDGHADFATLISTPRAPNLPTP